MPNNDLISRAAAIEAAIDGADDWDGGYNPERERHIREHIANVPAIDAIPVAWMASWINRHPNDLRCVWFVSLEMEWRKEQEAR